MEKLFRINLCLAMLAVFFMLLVTPSFSAQRNMAISWTANTDDAVLYRIYMNNAPVADVAGILTNTWTGAVNLVEGSNKFELTAIDAAGNESLRSDPCFFVLDTVLPARPTGLKVILKP